MDTNTKVLFYTDSRGRGQPDYIRTNNFFQTDDTNVIVQAGGTIDHLCAMMKGKVKSLGHPFFGALCIVMAAGICNFTQKINLGNNKFQIIYKHDEDKISAIKEKLSYLYSFMSKNNVFFKAVHIPSSSLLKSKKISISKGKLSHDLCIMSDSDLIEQQYLLETAIS